MVIWRDESPDLAPKKGKEENSAPVSSGEIQCSFGLVNFLKTILFSTRGNISKL